MAKLHILLALAIFVFTFALTCSATVYTVGDNSGWDISTDLDTWTQNKKFLVGDVLLFQYSSVHSVDEVTEDNYEGCNTTNVLQSSSNGNTSYVLSAPGDRYFVCGNRLHCLAGMKLLVHVEENGTATAGESPAAAPQAEESGGGAVNSLPTPSSSKSKTTSAVSSAVFIHKSSSVVALLGILAPGLFGVV